MNERIRLLAEQAKKYALDAMIKITDKEQALKVYSESYDTKFAQLIVQDIINDLGQAKWLGESNGWDLAIEAVRTDLIKHFGVEE